MSTNESSESPSLANYIWGYRFPSGWERIVDPTGCGEGEFYETATARAGYIPHEEREAYCRSIMVQYGVTDTPATLAWPFLVTLTLRGDRCYSIYCDCLPSLLEVLAKLAPFDLAESFDSLAAEYVEPFTRRFFRASHGHGLDGVCPACDPHEHEARARMRREARERERKQQEANRKLAEAAAEEREQGQESGQGSGQGSDNG